METSKTSNKAAYTGILTAMAASVCCITPVLALLAGASGDSIDLFLDRAS